ncbi:polyprenyl synthetase family protein [Streptomyces sp. NPDC085946]|uniref:polyprenyl synthetase family protein n=1 Tax=Streptomyces sp. NPDC085946 TaxID=3365744 RepID=UPI0037D3EB5F
MRPSQAKEHHTGGPPPAPRLVPLSGSPARARPDGPAAGPPDAWAVTGTAPLPPGVGDARAVDEDVPAAVGRVLGHLLAERTARARAVDPLFAEDLAGRVARFTEQGGRRMRARLLWGALRACGGDGDAAVAAALRIGAALELVQTCALVHDDVMDGAALRRGRAALHVELAEQYAGAGAGGPRGEAEHAEGAGAGAEGVGGGTEGLGADAEGLGAGVAGASRAGRFGNAAAILAGDLALAWADDVVAETVLAPEVAAVVRRIWSDLRTEMVAGQYLDVQGQVTGASSLPRALRAACLKSALYSVERPLALGAALAGADAATLRALCSAGRCVGMAFQLRDDLDDVFGDSRRTGKPAGGDIREGKATYLVALARARAEAAGDRDALAVLERSLGSAALSRAGLDEVREVLVRTGARDAVRTRIERLVAEGLRHLDGALLDPEGGHRLRRLLGSVAGGPGPAASGPGDDATSAGRDATTAPGRDAVTAPGRDATTAPGRAPDTPSAPPPVPLGPAVPPSAPVPVSLLAGTEETRR